MLSKTGEGTNVTAVANVWKTDSDPRKYAVQNQAIIAGGTGAGPFSKIDTVRFSNHFWNTGGFYVDDIEIFTAGHPKSTLLLLK